MAQKETKTKESTDMIGSLVGQGADRQHRNARSHVIIASPLGDLTAVRQSEDLVGVYFRRHRPAPSQVALGVRNTQAFEEVERQLGEYFAGARGHFDLPYRLVGEERDRKVWALVARIPYGETVTYGQTARELGEGTTPQEVGAALARNPLCIVIPCHRVVRADGRLAGYAGGLDRKRLLLELEHGGVGRAGRLF